VSESSFGPYRVVRKLGQGGMGVVYLGEHNLIGRRAAIKVLHRERGAQRENVERFFNEARATSAVDDPGIVHIYDFGITPQDTAYLVMEYLDGESLSVRLRRRGPLPCNDAVRITRQIASSLAAAHAANIVHRDLKPENLFMVRDGEALGGERPKILDFGIAKLGDDGLDRFQTRTGAVMGTPAYMSPEQCNAGKIDQRTDIYSLGCVLFHLLLGRPPFDLQGVGAIIAAHLREPAPVPSAISPNVPAILDPLIARCLAKDPDDRFSSMSELQQACDAVLGQLPAVPVMTAPDLAVAHADRAEAVTTLGHSVGQSSGAPRCMVRDRSCRDRRRHRARSDHAARRTKPRGYARRCGSGAETYDYTHPDTRDRQRDDSTTRRHSARGRGADADDDARTRDAATHHQASREETQAAARRV